MTFGTPECPKGHGTMEKIPGRNHTDGWTDERYACRTCKAVAAKILDTGGRRGWAHDRPMKTADFRPGGRRTIRGTHQGHKKRKAA